MLISGKCVLWHVMTGIQEFGDRQQLAIAQLVTKPDLWRPYMVGGRPFSVWSALAAIDHVTSTSYASSMPQ